MNKPKVLVIGNGSSVREHKLGKEIDKFDVVVRFNRGYFEGIKGHEEYVGTKTDILIVHDGYAQPKYLTESVLDLVPYVLVVIPNFKLDQEMKRIYDYGWGTKVQVIHKNYEDRLNELSDFGSTWPTTGLVGLSTMCHNYGSVTIHGFDGWDKAYEHYHYFDEADDRTTEHAWRENRTDHKLEAEIECIQKIIEQYNIKRLTDE
tara:strand:- start:2321 stop:2932 length:612 start_codon:yes stop_codon:yes gene_type:complete